MHSTPARLIATAVIGAVAVAGAGLAWEIARFGTSNESAAARLEAQVRDTFAARAVQVRTLAERIASRSDLVAAADVSREGVAALFARVMFLAGEIGVDAVSATVYAPSGPPHEYRVLAWSSGPAEDLKPDRLAGPPALFVAPGTLGLQLVYVQPIERDGRRLGVAAAEAVLSPVAGAAGGTYRLETPLGPVSVAQVFSGAGETPRPDTFLVGPAGAAPLLSVSFSSTDLTAARAGFRRCVLAAAALPLIAGVLLLTGPVLRRRKPGLPAARWLWWSLVGAAAVALGGASLAALSAWLSVSPALTRALIDLTGLGLAGIFVVSWWWRHPERQQPAVTPARFVVEQLLAGLALAASLIAAAFLLRTRITPASLEVWEFPLLPVETESLLYHVALVLAQVAIGWTAGLVLAIVAGRWRLNFSRAGSAALAILLWLAPTALLLIAIGRFGLLAPLRPLPYVGLGVAAVAAVLFALTASAVRRRYRRTTQAMRLILNLAALVAPPVVLYPMAWFYADHTVHSIIADVYAPATAGHPQELRSELVRATEEIDQVSTAQLLRLASSRGAEGSAVPIQMAFAVWSRTSLARTRLTSAIELYGPDRTMASRFALNVPEYRTVAQARTWQGVNCDWEVFGEMVRFGAEERHMIHAGRSLCGAEGRTLGAVVVYLVQDYEALPFVASANPYAVLLQASDAPSQRHSSDLQVVVYGWSFHPVFTSANRAWALPATLVDRLVHSREPFWATLQAEDRTYNVYFTSDSRGIYAIGHAVTTPFQHLTRLAAGATVSAALFVLLLVGAAIYIPLARHGPAPLRTLVDEIRTSFYRKLFLFFVLAAVGPVVLIALAFGAYMTTKLREDVASESRSVVIVARHMLEELVALQQRPDQPQAPLTDDVMVWISQALKQDVNLYDGSSVAATSQRDLYASGLLSVRTPAASYRAIALDRLPTDVSEVPLGPYRYLVAAAPVPARGPDALVTVPLALRQREIERDIDEVNRGVIVGGVFVILFAAGLGASIARRVADPVSRLTRATRQIAAGRLDVRIVADTADELRRLVDDFNSMAATLGAQRVELARSQQLKAWAEMARQVAHEIKNPLTPIQLAAEHLDRVHQDQGRPLGAVFDQCVTTILQQVRLLRQIASEFSNFAGEPAVHPTVVQFSDIVDEVVRPYRSAAGLTIEMDLSSIRSAVRVDRTLLARAMTNVVENAVQAMPHGGALRVAGRQTDGRIIVTFADTGVGMDEAAVSRAFEPYFSTKTAGSGLGLANARRNVERCGGEISLTSAPGRGTEVTITLPAAEAERPVPFGAPESA